MKRRGARDPLFVRTRSSVTVATGIGVALALASGAVQAQDETYTMTFEGLWTADDITDSSLPVGALSVLRILNDTAESGPVDIYAIDDSGTVSGPATFTLNAMEEERFTQTGESDGITTSNMGSYDYQAIGPDAGLLTLMYDDGNECRAETERNTPIRPWSTCDRVLRSLR